MKGIIYKYTSPSGKSYIGQTIDPERRMGQHRRMVGNNTAFHSAIKKYGFDNFQYEVLVTVDLDDEQELKQKLDFFERFYIRKYHTYENGYNLTLGGGGVLGCTHTVSEEAKQKISEKLKGRVISEEWRLKNSEAHKGCTFSEEHKQKISEAGKGRTFSDEVRRKISEAQKGRKKGAMSEEQKKKISETLKGRKKGALSEETKQKISESKKGKHFMSDEAKRKISEARKLYWEQKKQLKSA